MILETQLQCRQSVVVASTQWQLEPCLSSAEKNVENSSVCVLFLVVIVHFDVRRIESNVRHG